MATTSPVVTLVHATDAPQHLAELKTILQRLKSEERISGFTSADASQQLPPLLGNDNINDGVIVMLTHDLQRLRADIERSLRERLSGQFNSKFIEIIVDNVPYNNDFITFPDDLRPIRSREDMDAVWRGIERDLALMFPKHVIVPVETPQPRRIWLDYLRLAGIVLGTFMLSVALLLIFQKVFQEYLPGESSYYSDYSRPFHFKLFEEDYGSMSFFHLLFATAIPLLIFRTKAMRTSKDGSGTNSVNWKLLLSATTYGIIVFFVSLTFLFILFSINILSPSVVILLPPLLTLMLLYRKNREAITSKINKEGSSESESGNKALLLEYLKVGLLGLVSLYIAWKLLALFLTAIS